MLVFPDNPEKGSQEILLGLKCTVLELQLGSHSPLIKTVLLGEMVKYLAIQSQDALPFHLSTLQSNDSLYSDSSYKEALLGIIREILDDITTLVITPL